MPRWRVVSLPPPHFTHYTSTVAGESADNSVAFNSSFFSLAMSRPVSRKGPNIVAMYLECPSWQESPLWHQTMKVPCGTNPRESYVASNQVNPKGTKTRESNYGTLPKPLTSRLTNTLQHN